MKLMVQRLAVIAISAFAIPVLIVAPAYARQGSDDDSVSTSTTSTVSTNSEGEDDSEVEVEHITQTEVKNRVEAFRLKAQEQVKMLEAKKEDAKKRTEEERTKSCEARSAELTKKLNKKVADATKHKAVFDKIYTRVTDFYKTKNLNVAGYDAMVTKVDSAQAAADASIATLKGFDTTVDCTQVDSVATKVAAFQAGLKDTRDALKAYRTAIKDLIVAVKGNIPAENTSTTTTTNNSSTTSTGN